MRIFILLSFLFLTSCGLVDPNGTSRLATSKCPEVIIYKTNPNAHWVKQTPEDKKKNDLELL